MSSSGSTILWLQLDITYFGSNVVDVQATIVEQYLDAHSR